MQSTISLPRRNASALSYQELKALADLILEEPEHYTVLGIDPKATFEEINQAYCIAVAHFHPLNHRAAIGSDKVFHWLLSRTFTRLGIAYRILSNPRRRDIYDRSLGVNSAPVQANAPLEDGDDMDPTERLNLQSYAFATPEWLLAKSADVNRTSEERRRVVRVKMRIPVLVTFGNLWQEKGETRDLSPLGARIALSRHVEPGTLLRLQLRMPSQFRTRDYDGDNYEVYARVLRMFRSQSSWEAATEFI
jgi:curved DNA-binding protein CbpA